MFAGGDIGNCLDDSSDVAQKVQDTLLLHRIMRAGRLGQSIRRRFRCKLRKVCC